MILELQEKWQEGVNLLEGPLGGRTPLHTDRLVWEVNSCTQKQTCKQSKKPHDVDQNKE